MKVGGADPNAAGQPVRERVTAARTSALDRLLRHWLVSVASAAGAAPRILASVRLGRTGFRPFPGEPQKGFRPLRVLDRARPRDEKRTRSETSTAFGLGGASRPVSFFGMASVSGARWPRLVLRNQAMVSSPVFVSRKGGEPGSAAYGRCGCGTELGADTYGCLRIFVVSGTADAGLGACGRLEGPRRGTKPMEGQGTRRSATVARCLHSTAEKRPEVDAPVR
jgi:hypothetical protein